MLCSPLKRCIGLGRVRIRKLFCNYSQLLAHHPRSLIKLWFKDHVFDCMPTTILSHVRILATFIQSPSHIQGEFSCFLPSPFVWLIKTRQAYLNRRPSLTKAKCPL